MNSLHEASRAAFEALMADELNSTMRTSIGSYAAVVTSIKWEAWTRALDWQAEQAESLNQTLAADAKDAWNSNRELREQLALEQSNARQSREEIDALKADVAAMAENQGEWMRRAMGFEDQLAAAQARVTALNSENNTMASLMMDETRDKHAAQAEARRLREALWEIDKMTAQHSSVLAKEVNHTARAAIDEGGEQP